MPTFTYSGTQVCLINGANEIAITHNSGTLSVDGVQFCQQFISNADNSTPNNTFNLQNVNFQDPVTGSFSPLTQNGNCHFSIGAGVSCNPNTVFLGIRQDYSFANNMASAFNDPLNYTPTNSSVMGALQGIDLSLAVDNTTIERHQVPAGVSALNILGSPTTSSNASQSITVIDPSNGLTYTITLDAVNIQLNTFLEDGTDAPSAVPVGIAVPITDGITPSLSPYALGSQIVTISAVPTLMIFVGDNETNNVYIFTFIAGVYTVFSTALSMDTPVYIKGQIIGGIPYLFISNLVDNTITQLSFNGTAYVPSAVITTGRIPASLDIRGLDINSILDVSNAQDATIGSYTWDTGSNTFINPITINTVAQGSMPTVLSDIRVALVSPTDNSISVFSAVSNVLTLLYTTDMTPFGNINSNTQKQAVLFSLFDKEFIAINLNNGGANSIFTFQITDSALIKTTATASIGNGGEVCTLTKYSISANYYLSATNESQNQVSALQFSYSNNPELVSDTIPFIASYPYAIETFINNQQYRGATDNSITGLTQGSSQQITMTWSVPFSNECTSLIPTYQEGTTGCVLSVKPITAYGTAMATSVVIEVTNISPTNITSGTVTVNLDGIGN